MSVPFANGRPVPCEVLEKVALELVRVEPLGTPHQLLPLLLTSRAVNAALSIRSNAPLYAQICRLKFDVGAVTRRAFTPGVRDLSDHLVQMCNLVRFLQRGDIHDVETSEQLLAAFVCMLDNDGKNRAQLEHAGIGAFVRRVVRERLDEGKEENDMWPQSNMLNACALWLMWMFTTRESLLKETPQERDEIMRLLFPFIACPYRYASSLVPPNHFTLPLGPSNPVQQCIYTSNSVHGPYPMYHIQSHSPIPIHYFRSNPNFLEPLIAPVAKLLYWSRRELHTFFRPLPFFPRTRAEAGGTPGVTVEDLDRYNRHKVAKLLDDVVWDWDAGVPVCRLYDESGATGTGVVWKVEDSMRWDVDWWRQRLCHNVFLKQPKWRMGSVYERGMLSGSWQGVQWLLSDGALRAMLSNPQPVPGFSERTLDWSARPIIMRLTEHGFVRTPTSRASPIPAAPPCRLPISRRPDADDGTAQETLAPIDGSLSNAWFPGPVGSVRWAVDQRPLDVGILTDKYHRPAEMKSAGPMPSTRFHVSREPVEIGEAGVKLRPDLAGAVAEEERRGADVSGDVYVYETYVSGGESAHARLEGAKGKLFCGAEEGGAGVHPGCLRCAEREALLEERRRELEQYVDVEGIFETVGMGMDLGEGEEDECLGVVDIDLDMDEDEDGDMEEAADEVSEMSSSLSGTRSDHKLRSAHSVYRVEKCDDGVEDVVLTGDMTEDDALAWGRSMYYGRVRPWDGLIAILRIAYDTNTHMYAHWIYYGYIYGGNTFVGNWRQARMDPLLPGFECSFVMSKRVEG